MRGGKRQLSFQTTTALVWDTNNDGHRFIVLGHQYGGCDVSHVKTLYFRDTAV